MMKTVATQMKLHSTVEAPQLHSTLQSDDKDKAPQYSQSSRVQSYHKDSSDSDEAS